MPIRSDPNTWTDPRQVRGLEGEAAAAEYLVGQGWTILDHRFRMRRFEVDIVARRVAVARAAKIRSCLVGGTVTEGATDSADLARPA